MLVEGVLYREGLLLSVKDSLRFLFADACECFQERRCVGVCSRHLELELEDFECQVHVAGLGILQRPGIVVRVAALPDLSIGQLERWRVHHCLCPELECA